MPLTKIRTRSSQTKPETARLARVLLREFVSDQQQRAAMCGQDRRLVWRWTRIGKRHLWNECPPLRRDDSWKIRGDLPFVRESARERLFCRRGSIDKVNDVRRLSRRQCETLTFITCRRAMSLVSKN